MRWLNRLNWSLAAAHNVSGPCRVSCWNLSLSHTLLEPFPLPCREAAIQKFNAPNSECFIFLLSIRAAGRGLNLQSSDTVVIYDPDPNPKNEEQVRPG